MLTQCTRMLDRLGAVLSKIFNLIGGIALVLLIPSFAWLVYGRYVLNSTPNLGGAGFPFVDGFHHLSRCCPRGGGK